MTRSVPMAAVLPLLLLATDGPILAAASPEGDRASKKVEKHLAKAETALIRGDTDSAQRSFALADKAAGGTSSRALLGMAGLAARSIEYGRAIQLGHRATEVASSPEEKAEAFLFLGRSFYDSVFFAAKLFGGDPEAATTRSLTEAEGFYRQAIAAAPGSTVEARYYLGRVLQELGRLDEAREAFGEYLELDPSAELAPDATARVEWLANPEPARLVTDPEELRSLGPPVELRAPMPVYPELARRHRIEGRVLIETVVDRFGWIESAEVVESIGHGLDESFLVSLRHWQFEPRHLPDGTAVRWTFRWTATLQVMRR